MKTVRWTTLLVGVVVFLGLFATPAAAKLSVSGKGARIAQTTERDWLRHPTRDRYYTESWTTILRSNNGDTVFVTFVYSNIGVVSGNTAVNVVFIPAGKPSQHFRWSYGTGDFGENAKTGRIVIGPNSMVLRGRELQLRVREKDFELEVDVQGLLDGVKFHDGKVFLDEAQTQSMQTFFHIPRGTFRGRVTVGGNGIAMEGDAYNDHAVQNALSTDFSDRWWTMRLFSSEYSLSFIAFRTPESAGGEVAMRMILSRGDELLAASDRMRITAGGAVQDPKGHRYETRYRLSFKDSALSFRGSVRRKRLIDREAFMENLGWLERQVAQMVAGNPIVYRMDAAAEIEITFANGDSAKIEGDAIIETIVMKDEGGESAQAEERD